MQKRDKQQQLIHRAVRQLTRRYKAASTDVDRRMHGRTHFIRPVQATTDGGRTMKLLARDISLSGVRLLSTHSLLGQQLRVRIPLEEDSPEAHSFVVRILWSAIVADGLYDNGGVFLEMAANEPLRLRIAEE